MTIPINYPNLITGIAIGSLIWIIIIFIVKIKKKPKQKDKPTFQTMKQCLRNAHNTLVEIDTNLEDLKPKLVDSANNLVKLYEAFNEIGVKNE